MASEFDRERHLAMQLIAGAIVVAPKNHHDFMARLLEVGDIVTGD
jgi:hypothetical protein